MTFASFVEGDQPRAFGDFGQEQFGFARLERCRGQFAARFHLAISSTEWGFVLCHAGWTSWIRVTDVPFVHERDDFRLLNQVPPLRDMGSLVQLVEDRYDIEAVSSPSGVTHLTFTRKAQE